MDFDETETQSQSGHKLANKVENEATLKAMEKVVHSMEIIPMNEALERLSYLRGKNVRQTTLSRSLLDIGGSMMEMPVYVYNKTTEAKAVSFKKCYEDDATGFTLVERNLTYHRADDEQEVPKEEVVKAFK